MEYGCQMPEVGSRIKAGIFYTGSHPPDPLLNPIVHWGRFPVHPVYLKLQQQPKHSLYLTARVTPLSPSGDTAGSYDVMENRSPNPLRMFSITWQRFSHAWERFFPVMISVAVHEVLPDT